MIVGVLKDVCRWIDKVLVLSFVPSDNIPRSIDELEIKFVFSYLL